jgi:polar amino acid transport system substrate-binding protein
VIQRVDRSTVRSLNLARGSLLRAGLCFVLGGAASACVAATVPGCPSGPIRLSYLEFGSLYYQTRGMAGAGIDADIIAELGRRSGCQFKIVSLVRARTWLEMRSGRLDMTTSALRTAERDEFSWFIPYLRMHHEVLLGPAARGAHSMAQFDRRHDLRFGVVRGYRHTPFYDEKIDEWRKQERISEYVDEPTLLHALRTGEIAGALSYSLVYRHYLSEAQLKPIARLDWEPGREPNIGQLMLAKHQFSAAESEQWGALIDAMYRDGSMRRILARYLSAAEIEQHLLKR